MKVNFAWLVICLIPLTQSGCASWPGVNQGRAPVSSSVFDREQHYVDELLAYARHYDELTAENQKKEYNLAMQALNHNRQDALTRLKAALVLALPGSRFRDNGRALALLNELQRDKTLEEDVAGLVVILKEFVAERQGLEDNAAKLTQKAREEQNRADDLQQKLDELKNIEKTLQDRKPTTKR